MSVAIRKSRVGFAVIKLQVAEISYFLMRINPKWRDLNFIGGHEKPRDGRDLKKTARRELWEEVPSVRQYSSLELEPLTDEIHYGPVYSRSKGDQVEYDVQFFLLRIFNSPTMLVELLSSRTKNIWISEQQMLEPSKYKLSDLVSLLDQSVPSGLHGIPFSSAIDLHLLRPHFDYGDGKQLMFALK